MNKKEESKERNKKYVCVYVYVCMYSLELSFWLYIKLERLFLFKQRRGILLGCLPISLIIKAKQEQ